MCEKVDWLKVRTLAIFHSQTFGSLIACVIHISHSTHHCVHKVTSSSGFSKVYLGFSTFERENSTILYILLLLEIFCTQLRPNRILETQNSFLICESFCHSINDERDENRMPTSVLRERHKR